MPKFTLKCLFAFILCLASQVLKGQVASFIASDTSGCVGLIVHFTNTSTGASSYQWDLGNGPKPTTTDASGSYLTAGVYTVTLTANPGPSSSTYTVIVRVYNPPTVAFTASDTAICPGTPITFTSTSVPNSWGSLTYNWNFGDGGTSTASTPVYTYNTPGYYNVNLFATNAPGCTNSLSKSSYIHVYNHSNVGFTATPTSFCKTPKVVTFTNTTTGAGPFTYKWSFGDGGTSTAANPTHNYVSTGSYNVTLRVTDAKGCVDSLIQYSYINSGALVAAFTPPSATCAGVAVNFNNTSSSHISCQWYFGDGGTSTDDFPAHGYLSSGTFTVKLVVFDGSCYDSTTHTITINPLPVGSFSSTPIHPCPPPVSVTYTASVSGGTTVAWLFGDGTTGTGPSKVKTYSTAVTDYIDMILTSSAGCKDTFQRIDTIYNLYLNPSASATNGCAPLSTSFTVYPYSVVYNTFTSNYDFYTYPYAVTSYSWNYGDGSAFGSGPSPSHTYTAPGSYLATCTILTANGCTGVGTVAINIGHKGVASFTSVPRHVCTDRVINFKSTSTGTIDMYDWVYGDGGSDIGPGYNKTVHIYSVPGIYNPSLIVEEFGCKSAPFYLTDTVDSPSAVINYNYSCIPANQIVFKDASLGDDTHLWQFGDATTSTAANPIHAYPSLSSYTVILTTYNIRSGCRDTTAQTIDLARPHVDFTATKLSLCRDVVDSFTSIVTGSGSPASRFKWYIDGVLKDSVHQIFITTFKTTGLHSISLIITDSHGCYDTVTKTNYVLVAKPIDNFTFTPTSGCAALPVTFTDASTGVAGTSMATYMWTFGDGATSTVTSATVGHTYTSSGTYSIKEIVTDNLGCKDTLTNLVKLNVYKPISSFTASGVSVCMNTSIHFNNTSTSAASYLWLFGDGATSTLTAPDHVYTASGTYTVKLASFDIHGCIDTMIRTNYININPGPLASFTLSDSFAVCPPLNVHFTNTSTGAISYTWAFGDGSFSTVTSPSEPYVAPGLYTVRLVARNAYACTDTAYHTVNIFGYKGAFKYTPLTGCANTLVHFKATLSTVASIIWDFNDGITSGSSLLDTISHIYVSPGEYVPKLILKDTSGCTAFSVGADTIKIDTLIPNFTISPNPACQNTLVTFRDASYSMFSASASYLWTFGSGVTSTMAAATHVYTAPGSFSVSLFVIDTIGCSGTATKTVTVNPLPAPITGVFTLCMGTNSPLTDASPGGTWTSSKATVATVGSSSGVVTGMGPGTATISYTIPTGCVITAVVTINPLPKVINGATGICNGLTTVLSDTTTGGIWSSSNTSVATISSTGLVSSVSLGTTTITYFLPSTGCQTTTTVTIANSPVKISGPSTICLGSTATLSNASTGGLWTSVSTTIATIGSTSGVVSGLALGTSAITYSLGTGCTVGTTVTVIPVPLGITGGSLVCAGLTLTLSDATTGGGWSSVNTSIATVGTGSGIVTALAGGVDTIYYTLGTGCNASKTVTINPIAPISGATNICLGATGTLSNSIAGGTWTSLNLSIATIGSVSGLVTTKAVGSTTIKYVLPSGCSVTTTVTVINVPAPIAGPSSVCVGSTIILSDPTTGGTWSCGNTMLATVGVTSGLVNGLASGTVLMSYSIGTGCKSYATIVVNPISGITGPKAVCVGQAMVLQDTTLGGTWSSSNTTVATAGTWSGAITGISGGTATITYMLSTGCFATYSVNVTPPPSAITGTTYLCAGLVTVLSDASIGGTWLSSSTGVATIGVTSGVVSGLAAGTSTIYYTVGGCSISTMVTVNPIPAPINGSPFVCFGSATALSDATTGGQWSSSVTSVATIGSGTGVVTGWVVGTTTITYTLSTGCLITRTETVNPLPATIKGITHVCEGLTTILSDATTGGTWSSSNTLGATVDITSGLVTGVAASTVDITYTVIGCTAVTNVTVNPLPAPISGSSDVCVGSTMTLSDASGGGIWTSSTKAYATIGSTSGLVKGISAGADTITYTLGTGCLMTATIMVNPLPLPITGVMTMCTTLSTNLSDATSYGEWTSGNTAIATVDPSWGIVTGTGPGTAAITYTLATGCIATAAVTVYPFPTAITGPSNICLFAPVTLTDTITGGTWTSDNTSVATVGYTSGVVTGVSLSTATIDYTIASSCSVYLTVSVMPLPTVFKITGGGNYCSGGSGLHIGLNGSAVGTEYFLYLGGVKATGPLAGTGLPLDFGLQTVGGTYTVVATNTYSGCTTNMSGSAIILVLKTVVPAVTLSTGVGDTVCSGFTTKFTPTVTDGGTSPTYAWYVNGTKVSTLPTYTFVPADKDAITVKVHSNAACATPDTAITTKTMTVTVPEVPSAELSTFPGDTICNGEKVTFTPFPHFGGTAPTYDWLVNGVLSGSGPTFTYVPTNKDIVHAMMTSNYPCLVKTTVPSNNVVMTVDSAIIPHITITGNPGTSIGMGQSDTLVATVTDAGTNPTYQWLVNGLPIIGATTSTYISSNFSYPAQDSVTCMVTSSGLCTITTFNWVYISVHYLDVKPISGEGGLTIIPNPNKGEFVIKGSVGRNDEEVSIEITDLLGQIVYRNSIMAKNGNIDQRILLSSTLANSMYILNVRSGTDNKVFHIVIER